MKNSKIALILTFFIVIWNLYFNSPIYFLSCCLFTSTYLILKQLEEKDKK